MKNTTDITYNMYVRYSIASELLRRMKIIKKSSYKYMFHLILFLNYNE